jgi:hypothetical protein
VLAPGTAHPDTPSIGDNCVCNDKQPDPAKIRENIIVNSNGNDV